MQDDPEDWEDRISLGVKSRLGDVKIQAEEQLPINEDFSPNLTPPELVSCYFNKLLAGVY